MRVIAALSLRRALSGAMIPAPRPGARSGSSGGEHDLLADKAEQVERIADIVVRSLLENPELPAAKAVEAVRDDLARLLADPTDPVVDQLAGIAAQLSDRLARPLAADSPVTPQQARRLLGTLTPLTAQLSAIATELPACAGTRRLCARAGAAKALVRAGLHGSMVQQLVAGLLTRGGDHVRAAD